MYIVPVTSAAEILRFAASRQEENWTYIIMGRPGPTGKTYTWDLLRKNGYNAIEISEDIFNLVEYRDDKNHFLVNDNAKRAIIVRNKILPAYADKWEKCRETIPNHRRDP